MGCGIQQCESARAARLEVQSHQAGRYGDLHRQSGENRGAEDVYVVDQAGGRHRVREVGNGASEMRGPVILRVVLLMLSCVVATQAAETAQSSIAGIWFPDPTRSE